MYPFERFTNEAKGVLALAQEEAERSRLAYIGTEHLVIGLIRQEGLGGRALLSLGQSVDGLRKTMLEVLGDSEARVVQQIIPTSRVKTIIEMSFDEARRLLEGEGLGASMLASSGVTVDKVRAEVDRLRAAGISEHVGEPPTRMHRKRRHFELADARGETIEVDLAFPPEYSEEDCQAVTDRIKAVFRGP
ncbi:MAG: hypothetical protein E6H93_10580 [Chloroflexi bacterium]|nr:MAG: hypothetical protein E6H93_10580 [Chloroflexota bacterium]